MCVAWSWSSTEAPGCGRASQDDKMRRETRAGSCGTLLASGVLAASDAKIRSSWEVLDTDLT